MVEPRDIVEGAMIDLTRGIQQIAKDRDKNATGATSRSIEVMAVGGQGVAQGTLIANKNWRYMGSGRAPGKRPPLAPLRAWIAARHLSISEYALANKIAKEGTHDYQVHNPNVFIQGIDAWEQDFPKVEGKLADNLMDRTEQLILQNAPK